MELVVLGSRGGGLPNPARQLMAEAVIIGGEPILVECGGGVTRRLQEAGLAAPSVRYLFFTHHHHDHNSGYVHFVQTAWLEGSGWKLNVFGPPETARMTELLFGRDGAYRMDQVARVDLGASQEAQLSRTGKALSWIDIAVTEIESGGEVCRTDNWTATAVRTQHVEYMDTYAYRFDSPEGSIVIAHDTAPTQAVVDLARGADILVHECSAPEEWIHRFEMQRAHTWPKAVAQIANEAGVRKLVCTHFFPEIDNPSTLEQMAAEVRGLFSGEVYMAEDLLRVAV